MSLPLAFASAVVIVVAALVPGRVLARADRSAPVLDAGPLAELVDSAVRFSERHEKKISLFRGYAQANLRIFARPKILECVDDQKGGKNPPDFKVLATRHALEDIFRSVLIDIKADVVQGQFTYMGSSLQGLAPLQWFILAEEIPGRDTFCFHHCLALIEALFDLPAVSKLVTSLNRAFWTCSGSDLLKAHYLYRKGRARAGADRAVRSQALRYCIDVANRYQSSRNTAFRRLACFFAVLHDTIRTGGANQVFAVYIDLRILSLRLRGVLAGPGGRVPRSRAAEEIELSVRESMIYGPRLISIAGIKAMDLLSSSGRTHGLSKALYDAGLSGVECVRRLGILQKRLFSIRTLQRRALRAVSEYRRVSAESSELDVSPGWMFADMRIQLEELAKEVRVCVYGARPGWLVSGSIDGLIFDPAFEAELAYLIAAVPENRRVGAGVVSARNEVFRLLAKIKEDENRVIIPFLRTKDRTTTRKAEKRVPLNLDKVLLRSRLETVEIMLSRGRTQEGALLSPHQIQALFLEKKKLKSLLFPRPVSQKAVSGTTAVSSP